MQLQILHTSFLCSLAQVWETDSEEGIDEWWEQTLHQPLQYFVLKAVAEVSYGYQTYVVKLNISIHIKQISSLVTHL